ncbi:beta-glucosidase [Oleiagrimonas sp. C23AA]|nr:beta-glucosidase [Oleiagrimonas sp. C23AA]
MNPKFSPDKRADLLVSKMTQAEKLHMIRSYFGSPGGPKGFPMPKGALGSAGYVPAIPRLGIPALQESDAGMGVANPHGARPGDGATSLPSGLATAATWTPQIAYKGGKMIGHEAWSKGFNILLAGGIDLVRDPRNGRNFEYAGEDPLLAGEMVGSFIKGIQSQHVISTIKHYAVNDQETARTTVSAVISKKAMRESDLLAFEIAIAKGDPGSVMCSYNKVNGDWACENKYLLTDVLKDDWKYPGFVMSDWGGTHSSAKAVNAGLDQESAGEQFDDKEWFDKPLKQDLADGKVSEKRLDDMVHRILRSMFAVGLFEHPPTKQPVNRAADKRVAQHTLEAGAVLLRNEHDTLPLASSTASVAVIGAHADKGVLAGGGSSVVVPWGGNAVPGLKPTEWPGPIMYQRSAPMAAIASIVGKSKVHFAEGDDIAKAVALAKRSKVAVVFAQKWAGESFDWVNLKLDDNQDQLIEAVAKANPNTIVVLETNGPVDMPWLDQVGAVLEAWYPGSGGGPAIANILFGKVNPSGRLPVTWPRSLDQLPRKDLPGAGGHGTPDKSVDYNIEGADVGYRWFIAKDKQPLFSFGYGLSYTQFSHGTPKVAAHGHQVKVTVPVQNTGKRAGADVVQVYVKAPGADAPHLAGFDKVSLKAGASQGVTVSLHPKLLAEFDTASDDWRIAGGDYQVYVGSDAEHLGQPVNVHLAAGKLAP